MSKFYFSSRKTDPITFNKLNLKYLCYFQHLDYLFPNMEYLLFFNILLWIMKVVNECGNGSLPKNHNSIPGKDCIILKIKKDFC